MLIFSASSEVVNLSVVAITASKILVSWNDDPLFPNGPISYYLVCTNLSSCSTVTNSVKYCLLNNLKSLETYKVTVQPVTVVGNDILLGKIAESQDKHKLFL